MRINSMSMYSSALRALRTNQAIMQKSMQRLSTGLRINSAADDPSGLAISEKMRAQIRELKNTEDKIDSNESVEEAKRVYSKAAELLGDIEKVFARLDSKELSKEAVEERIEKIRNELL